MANHMQSIFTTVSETFFPGSGNLIDGTRPTYVETDSYLISSLSLQMTLYFNLHFSPIWLIICYVVFSLKFDRLDSYYQFILVVVYIVMTSLEFVRLYLGYSGNLQEKVPELAGFWLVTLILQLPLCGFILFNEAVLIQPMERAVNIIMFAFLLIEVVTGYRTIKRMTDAQVEKFRSQNKHRMQFKDRVENFAQHRNGVDNPMMMTEVIENNKTV